MLGVIAEVEEAFEFGTREQGGDILVLLQQVEEIGFAAPHRHGVPLHGGIGVLAAHALLGERQQDALRVDEAAQGAMNVQLLVTAESLLGSLAQEPFTISTRSKT